MIWVLSVWFEIISPAPIFSQLPPPIFSHCVYIQHFIAKILYYIYFSICIIWFKNRYILLPSLGFYYNEFIFSEILFFFLILKNYGISSSDILLFRQWKETTCNILFEKRIQYCNFFWFVQFQFVLFISPWLDR